MFRKTLTFAAILALSAAAANAQPNALILNEFNAVSDTEFYAQDPTPAKVHEGYDLGAIKDATINAGISALNGRPRAGRIMGNGGNWIELVVVQDQLDARGYNLQWSNTDPDAGGITFSNNPLWANLRAGTIITIMEDSQFIPTFDDGTTGPLINFGTPTTLSNTSFSPANNDWWINIDVDDSLYVSQTGFKVDNDNWQMTIKNSLGATIFGPIGEGVGLPNILWGGGGINSQESGALVDNPSLTASNQDFGDQDYSTFGAPNRFNGNTQQQSFIALQTWWTNRIPGDANCDGKVDIEDLQILAAGWLSGGHDWFGADFTGEGLVNAVDLGILGQHWQQGATASMPFDQALSAVGVPEPASASLILLPTLLLLRRRHRA